MEKQLIMKTILIKRISFGLDNPRIESNPFSKVELFSIHQQAILYPTRKDQVLAGIRVVVTIKLAQGKGVIGMLTT